MNVLDRKLVRDLAASKGLVLAITSLVAVGVMCFVYMRSAYYSLQRAQELYYAQSRMADFWIDLKKMPLAELSLLTDLPGISEIRPRIQFYATVDLDRVPEPLNGLVLTLPDARQSVINDVVLKRGSYFTDRRRNEVLVNDAFARHHKLHPGMWIHLILNDRREELFIVGTAVSSEFVYLVAPGALSPDPEHFGVFYLKQTFAEEVFDFDGAANQVVGLLAPGYREHPDDVLRRAEQRLEPYGVFAVTPRRDQPSNRFLSDEISGLGVFASIMPTIFLAIGALVLNVLMARLIEQQRTIVGTLKGLGYSGAPIFWHFIKFGGLIGVSGGLLGCLAGYGMSEMVIRLYRQFFEFPDLVNYVSPPLYLGGVAISLLCATVGSVQGARAALKLQPAEAMRAKPPAQGGHVWLDHVTWLWNNLNSAWRMTLRNVLRNRLRTGVGLLAAAMGAAILMTGFILQEAIGFLISYQFEAILKSDIDLSFRDERGIDAWYEARNLPGVDRAEPTLDVACEFFHGAYRRKGAITGLAPDARLTTPRDVAGNRVPMPRVGLAITRKLAELLHIRAGDTITVQPIKGLRQPRQVPVVAITDSYVGLSVYADIRYLAEIIGEELAVTGVQLQVDPRQRIRSQLYGELKQLPALQAMNVRSDMIANLNTVVETQKIFIGLLVLFAGVIFFASLLNASLISLAERSREVATLRVLGYGNWQIGALFLRESMVVNMLGTVLGMPLGYGLATYISTKYDTEMFRFPVIAPPGIWLQTVALAILFGLLAHAVVQRDIHKMNWRDALNVKE